MESFADLYYENSGLDVDKFIPRVPVKFREELCFKGKKIPYEDFTKFVRHGDDFIPLVCFNGQLAEEDIVMDLAPCLCVGVAEFMTMISHEDEAIQMRFCGFVHELEFAEDWFVMLEKAKEVLDYNVEDNEAAQTLSESLKSSIVDFRFPAVRRLYSGLMALRLINPKSFAIALLDAMRVSFSAMSMFIASDVELRSTTGGYKHALYEHVLRNKLNQFGAVEYTVPGSETVRRVSDGRGIGLSLMCLFIIDIYRRFGEGSGVKPAVLYDRPKSRRNALAMLYECLGDDYTGRLLRNGHCRVMNCDDNAIIMCNQANYLALECNKLVNLEGYKVGRGFYEGYVMWQKAVGAENVKTTGFLPPIDCSYGTRIDILHACVDFVFSGRGIQLTHDIMKHNEEDIMNRMLESMDIDAIIEEHRNEMLGVVREKVIECDSIVAKHTQALEDAEERIRVLEHQLAEKQHIIDDLRFDRDSLLSKVRSTYMEEDYMVNTETEELVESQLTNEEMLDFINQFRLVLVGGFDTMFDRMEKVGFTNFHVISSENVANTMASGDFFCICASFVSHKIEYRVEAQYPTQLGQFFRFNGTNVDVLIRVCYDFMKKWFEGTEV